MCDRYIIYFSEFEKKLKKQGYHFFEIDKEWDSLLLSLIKYRDYETVEDIGVDALTGYKGRFIKIDIYHSSFSDDFETFLGLLGVEDIVISRTINVIFIETDDYATGEIYDEVKII